MALRFLRHHSHHIPLFLASLAVLLFYLAFPTQGFANLTWFVMLPLMLAVVYDKSVGAFKLPLMAATVGWLIATWWVVPGLYKISGSNPGIILLLFILFCIYSALPYAIACYCFKRWRMYASISGAFASAAMFTLIVNYVPTVLPGNIAHGLYLETAQIQLAAFGGVPLVFFVIHLVCMLLTTAVYLRNKNSSKSIISVILVVALLVVNYGIGKFVLTKTHDTKDNIKVALIQPNFSISFRDRESWLGYQHIVKNLIDSAKATEKLDVILVPEIPVPVSHQYFEQDSTFFNAILDDEALFLTGIKPVGNALKEDDGYFNTVELIHNQQVQQTYAKRVLLPFGEYLPFENKLPFLRTLMPNVPNYFPGEGNTTLDLAVNNQLVKIAPLICYEAVFSKVVLEAVENGADIFINTSNDAWLGASAGGRIHLALSVFRAVEYKRPLIRVTNSGITQVFSHQAKPLNTPLPIDTASFDVVSIPLAKQSDTFYFYYADRFVFFYLAFLVFYFFRLKRQ